jgi:hypothetical protein
MNIIFENTLINYIINLARQNYKLDNQPVPWDHGIAHSPLYPGDLEKSTSKSKRIQNKAQCCKAFMGVYTVLDTCPEI